MTRIFTSLAGLLATALIVTFAVGVISHLRGSVHQGDDPTYFLHFVLGLCTSIGALFVHCIIFTYFLGTGRWVKEVALAYKIPDAPLPVLTRELKRKTFPPALAAMLVTIAASAAGAGAQLKEWPWEIHGLLAIATLGTNFWAFTVEYGNVQLNAWVIEQVLHQVDRIRAERGLPANAEALEQEHTA
jgi:hypothetical protein